MTRLYVYRLDRLARSGIRDTFEVVEDLRREHCELVTLADGFDLSGPAASGSSAASAAECFAHVVVINERHLRRLLCDNVEHYHLWRCHRSLATDCPEPRPVQGPKDGDVVEVEAGGLYCHYERRAA